MTDRLYIYWCPKCQIQTGRSFHIARRGDPLIPQNDEEHSCERVEVLRRDDLGIKNLEQIVKDAKELAERVLESDPPPWGDVPTRLEAKDLLSQILQHEAING